MTPLSPEAVAQMVDDIIADRAIGMPDHGGWAWFGGRDHVYLATRSGGRRYVMDFVRKGMKSAQPRFQIKGCMHGAVDELTTYQVGDGIARGQKQADADPSVYRLDVSGIDHPDARRMQRIPDMERAILTLAAENATLRAERDAVCDRLDNILTSLEELSVKFATLRASETTLAAQLAERDAERDHWENVAIARDRRIAALTEALKWMCDEYDAGGDGYEARKASDAALTPTADKEPMT